MFRTDPGDPNRLEPTEVSVDVSKLAGQTVRLRITQVDNQGPMSAGIDNIRFEPTGPDAAIELPPTPAAHHLSEADALASLAERAGEQVEADEFSGAVLVAHDGEILVEDAWGMADREAGTPNTVDTQFRIGSMNKMFTAVATLQLVEAGELELDDPIATYLPDYPNEDLASTVTIRQLLSHTGGPATSSARSSTSTASSCAPTATTSSCSATARAVRAGQPLRVLELRLHPARRRDRSAHRRVVLRLGRRARLPPAGMTATGSLPEDEDVPDRAVAYTRPFGPTSSWVAATDTLPYRGTSAGGGYSTVGDLLRFAEASRPGL